MTCCQFPANDSDSYCTETGEKEQGNRAVGILATFHSLSLNSSAFLFILPLFLVFVVGYLSPCSWPIFPLLFWISSIPLGAHLLIIHSFRSTLSFPSLMVSLL